MRKKKFLITHYRIYDERSAILKGEMLSGLACSYKVIKQTDGPFEVPVIFHEPRMGCWDRIGACPLDAVYRKEVL